MKSSRTTANWIFELLGMDVALGGDLLEERARGRSALWYWRQVLLAAWICIWKTIRDHKLLALRAVATGCAVNSVWLYLWLNFLHIGLPSSPKISIASIASLSIILFTQTVTGWIVARTHRSHAIPMVLVFAAWLLLWYLADFAEAKRLLADAIGHGRFIPYLAWYLTPISLEMTSLLCGAIAGARRTVAAAPKEP